MKKTIICLVAGILIATPIITYSAPNLASKLQGKILLAVEDRGRTYYVHSDGNRYLITKGTAQKVFEKLSLGITNENLAQIPLKELLVEEEVCQTTVKTVYKEGSCDYSEYVNKISELNKEIVTLKNKVSELSISLGEVDSKQLAKEELEKEYGLKINGLEKQILDLKEKRANAIDIVKQEHPSWNSINLPSLVYALYDEIDKQIAGLNAQISSLKNELARKLLEI